MDSTSTITDMIIEALLAVFILAGILAQNECAVLGGGFILMWFTLRHLNVELNEDDDGWTV